MREEAWSSFVIDSEVLFQGHFVKPVSLGQRSVRVFRVLFSWVLDLVRIVKGRRAGGSPSAAQAVPDLPHPGIGVMSGRPSQGSHQTAPVGSYMLEWERHFDAAQAFREAVVP